MKRKTALLALAVLAVLIAAGLWYTRPRTFWEVSGLERDDLTSIASYTSEGYVHYGVPYQSHYSLDALEPGSPEFEAILDLLEGPRYRASLRNLSPFPVDRSGHIDGNYIQVDLVSGVRWSLIDMRSPKFLFLTNMDGGGCLRFRVTDRGLQEALAQYLIENGTES